MNLMRLPKDITEDEAFRSCEPNDRLVYLLLCLSPYNNISGCFRCYVDDLIESSGLKERRIRKTFTNLQNAGLIVYKKCWVLIPAVMRAIRGQQLITGARRIVYSSAPPDVREIWEELAERYIEK